MGMALRKNGEEYFCRKTFENWIYFNVYLLQTYIPVALTSNLMLRTEDGDKLIYV